MSGSLFNRMRQESQRAGQFTSHLRMGRVTAYSPTKYAAKVNILPEGDFADAPASAETGWIPIDTAWAGNGWGMYCPPTIGQRVEVNFVEGDHGSGIITGCVYDLENIPFSVPSGEFWLVHKTGSVINLTNDGRVSIISDASIEMVTPAVRASQNLVVGTGASGSFTTPTGKIVTVQDGIIINIF